MTLERIAELHQLVERASPGPWIIDWRRSLGEGPPISAEAAEAVFRAMEEHHATTGAKCWAPKAVKYVLKIELRVRGDGATALYDIHFVDGDVSRFGNLLPAEMLAVFDRAAAETPVLDEPDGMWTAEGSQTSYAYDLCNTDCGVYGPKADDARFIAEARTAVPELLAEVAVLKAILGEVLPHLREHRIEYQHRHPRELEDRIEKKLGWAPRTAEGSGG